MIPFDRSVQYGTTRTQTSCYDNVVTAGTLNCTVRVNTCIHGIIVTRVFIYPQPLPWWSQYTASRKQWIVDVLITSRSSTVINSLWPCDVMWQHRTELTLAQAMACCLPDGTKPLNQFWLNITHQSRSGHINLRAISSDVPHLSTTESMA